MIILTCLALLAGSAACLSMSAWAFYEATRLWSRRKVSSLAFACLTLFTALYALLLLSGVFDMLGVL